MERETREIITPVDKHKVVIKDWITGREKRELKKPFLDGMKFSISEGTPKADDVNAGELMTKAENVAINLIVISVNGDNEKVLDKILDMKEKDFNFIVNEVNKIGGEVDFQKPGQMPNIGTNKEE